MQSVVKGVKAQSRQAPSLRIDHRWLISECSCEIGVDAVLAIRLGEGGPRQTFFSCKALAMHLTNIILYQIKGQGTRVKFNVYCRLVIYTSSHSLTSDKRSSKSVKA